MRWQGPIGPSLIAHLAGVSGARADRSSAFADPVAWALDVLGFPPGTVKPSRKRGDGPVPRPPDEVHPDHGGDETRPARLIVDLVRGPPHPARMTRPGALLLAPGFVMPAGCGGPRRGRPISLLADASSPPWSGWMVMSWRRKRAITSRRGGVMVPGSNPSTSKAHAAGSAKAMSDSALAPLTPARVSSRAMVRSARASEWPCGERQRRMARDRAEPGSAAYAAASTCAPGPARCSPTRSSCHRPARRGDGSSGPSRGGRPGSDDASVAARCADRAPSWLIRRWRGGRRSRSMPAR